MEEEWKILSFYGGWKATETTPATETTLAKELTPGHGVARPGTALGERTLTAFYGKKAVLTLVWMCYWPGQLTALKYKLLKEEEALVSPESTWRLQGEDLDT